MFKGIGVDSGMPDFRGDKVLEEKKKKLLISLNLLKKRGFGIHLFHLKRNSILSIVRVLNFYTSFFFFNSLFYFFLEILNFFGDFMDVSFLF